VDDDVELVEGSCPKCGGEVLRHDCTQIGCDDGFIDMHEYDDPLLFDEGEEEACNECHGRGYLMWCKVCGSDLLWKGKKIMPILEQEWKEIPMLSDEQVAAWLKQAEYEVEIGSTELLGVHYFGEVRFTTVDLLAELQHLRKVRDASYAVVRGWENYPSGRDVNGVLISPIYALAAALEQKAE